MKLSNKMDMKTYLSVCTEISIHAIQDASINLLTPIKHMYIMDDIYDFTELDVELLSHYIKQYNLHGIKFSVKIEELWNGNPQIILYSVLN